MAEIKYQLINTTKELSRALADLAASEVIGVDTETTGLDPYQSRLRLLQLASASASYLIDLFRAPQLAEDLKSLLLSQRPIKIFHNAKFDLKMIKHHLGLEVEGIYDTMLASQLISAGREGENHSLAGTAQRFLELAVDKGEQLSDWSGELSEKQLRYAANDAQVLLPLYRAQQTKLDELGLLETAALEFASVAPIAAMELAGILLDRERWMAIVKVIEQKHQEMAAQLRRALEPGSAQMSLFGEANINLDSPAQIQESLRRMGVPVSSTRSAQLQLFAKDHPVIEQLLEYRSLQKALTSYGEGMVKFIHPKTGRIHADFRQIGTPTGRLACHEPNIQQIPNTADYRSCFIAAPGHRLIIADYSQIELRILADWSGDIALARAFNSGLDLHRATASQMFGIALESVTPELRAAAKGLNYGIVYGMGAQGLALRIHRPVAEAEQLIERYFSTYNGVAHWLRRAGEQALATGYCRTRLGRLMTIDYDANDHAAVSGAVRLGKNMPIQGTSADITKRAMMLLRKNLMGSSARLVNNVHDELVVEVAAEEAEAVAARMRNEMEAASAEFIHNVPTIVDIKIAEAWLK
jgi:DNA polymerase-1